MCAINEPILLPYVQYLTSDRMGIAADEVGKIMAFIAQWFVSMRLAQQRQRVIHWPARHGKHFNIQVRQVIQDAVIELATGKILSGSVQPIEEILQPSYRLFRVPEIGRLIKRCPKNT